MIKKLNLQGRYNYTNFVYYQQYGSKLKANWTNIRERIFKTIMVNTCTTFVETDETTKNY